MLATKLCRTQVWWYSAVLLLLDVTQLTLSQITWSDGGRLYCRGTDCKGQSIVITAGQEFSVNCDATEACRRTAITVQANCTLSGTIECDYRDSCRDLHLTVYDSDLSAREMDCHDTGGKPRVCKDAMINLFGDSKLLLNCGYNSREDCVGMEIHVHDTSELIVKLGSKETPFTVYLYDQATVVDNNHTFTIVTESPTLSPTMPTTNPTRAPTTTPTLMTSAPTKYPSNPPTGVPTRFPTMETSMPTLIPTGFPTQPPTSVPSQSPTSSPSVITDPPSGYPTIQPTQDPTAESDPDSEQELKKSGNSDSDIMFLVIVLMSVIVVLSLIVCGFVSYFCYQRKETDKQESTEVDNAVQLARVTSLSSVDNLGEDIGPMPNLTVVPNGEEVATDTTSVFVDEGAPPFTYAARPMAVSQQMEGESDVKVPGMDDDELMYDAQPRIASKGASQAGASSVDAIRDEDEHELMYASVRGKRGITQGARKVPPPLPARVTPY